MKKILLPCCLAVVTFFTACKGNQSADYTPPAPGTVIDSISMPLVDDVLNHFVFKLKVSANANSAEKGSYDAVAEMGPTTANGTFAMPKGGEHLKPVIRKYAKDAFMIGFKVPNDTTFHEYFIVKEDVTAIKMEYTTSYSFN